MELYSIDMKDVKSRSGTLRAEHAAVTRNRIERSAGRLFASRGYGATTLREIAAEAGVAVQTIYAVYGSKANILRALRDAVVSDPAADAVYAEALAATDTADAMTAFARSIRLRWEAGFEIVEIHGDAASVDPVIRQEASRALAGRRAGIAALARSIARLDPDLADEERSAAILDTLTLPEVYGNLVGIHGWTADAYETWLAAALRLLVTRDPSDVDG
jgi:AcrR family transcriptional regulator